jgi:hypothetical protein
MLYLPRLKIVHSGCLNNVVYVCVCVCVFFLVNSLSVELVGPENEIRPGCLFIPERDTEIQTCPYMLLPVSERRQVASKDISNCFMEDVPPNNEVDLLNENADIRKLITGKITMVFSRRNI